MAIRLFSPGITALLTRHRDWIKGKRVGLLGHAASVDRKGRCTAELIASCSSASLEKIFGPEHGYFGKITAGKKVSGTRHPTLKTPIISLYGKHRRPTSAALRGLDIIVCDLQDIGARCYTYISTLRYMLEAAALYGKPVIVADRPVPLPSTIDGPVTAPGYESFVSALPLPLCYGMTPGETALWIRRTLNLDIDIRIARMENYHRQPDRERGWPPWISPSPGIVSWESAACYTATVFSEAIPAVKTDRCTSLAFRVFSVKGADHAAICSDLRRCGLRGVRFHDEGNRVRFTVTDNRLFRPAAVSVAIIHAARKQIGTGRLWKTARSDFFDKLYGTGRVRKMLEKGKSPGTIVKSWQTDIRRFKRTRKACLLYEEK